MSVWGPWIEHDGKGCPCKGEYVNTIDQDGNYREHIAHSLIIGADGKPDPKAVYVESAWDWSSAGYHAIIRYRIRKPRGMEVLQQLVADPVSEPEKVTT